MIEANSDFKLKELTGKIIQGAYHVSNTLGFGFLESVYEKSLEIKLKKMGLFVQRQHPIAVYFEHQLVGDFRADLIVENCVIVEIKSVETLHPIHEVQLVNYLKATEIEIGLLINFGHKAEIKRKIFSNDRKLHISQSD